MRRLLGVTVALTPLVVGVASAPAPAQTLPGPEAKAWAAKLARLGPRPAGGLNERRAGEIVRERLAALGYSVRIQRFTIPNGRTSRNVVGRTDGPVRVIIVAHMDSVLGTSAANDNASGVGVLLTVAKRLVGKDGVLVAALGAEERMYTGSSWHLGSRRLTRWFTPAQKAGVRLALSVDMVGYGPTLNIRGLESSPNRSARRLLNAARARGIRASYLRDTGQSDHDDLTRTGIAAAWIEWRWDPCWHRPCDRISRLRPYKLGSAARVVLGAARSVVG
ncbi:MAG TPA: M28 family peptidase [Gaiellaceae bacterium]|nr:M28 family peptidase [Gaiellaceae bacterium]